jgi:hypothetical protein
MGYGLSVSGTSNNLQIDSDQPYSYYRLIASGTGTSPSVTGLDTGKDLIFAKPSAQDGRLNCNVSGTTIGFSQSANYYVLRPVSSVSPSAATYGLRTFNSDGQLAFDSGYFGAGEDVILQVSNVVDSGQLVGNTGSANSVIYTGSDYRNYYANLNFGQIVGTTNYLNGFFWSSPTTSVRFESYVFVLGVYYYFRNPAVLLIKVAIP